MKRLLFSRKHIVRAIRAACLALYLATAHPAKAQVITGSSSNLTLSGTTSSSYVLNPTSSPALAVGGTLTVNAGSGINATQNTDSEVYALQIGSPSTLSNSGYLTAINNGAGPTRTVEVEPLTSTGDLTINNTSTGSITANSAFASANAIDIYDVEAGNISITNNGTISSSSSYSNAYGITATAAGAGTITISSGNQITVGGSYALTAFGIIASSDNGGISITNTGNVTATTYSQVGGIEGNAAGNGAVSITNSGYIQGSVPLNTEYVDASINYGLAANAEGTGDVTINNSGAINIQSGNIVADIYVNDSGTGAINITNTSGGTLTSASGSYPSAGIEVIGNNSSVGNVVTITNSAAINASGSGYSRGIEATILAGSINITNSGAIDSSGAVTSGITASAYGNVTVTNNAGGTITSSNYGIIAHSANGTAQVNNAASITTSSQQYTLGLVVTGSSASVTNSGTISGYTSGIGNPSAPVTGIQATATSSNGPVTIRNTGNVSVSTNAHIYNPTGPATAILASSAGGPISVTNSGNLTATTTNSNYYSSYGIRLTSPGTVINSGNITAGTAAISLTNGSSLTLEGLPTINGLISGGNNTNSGSLLTFELTIPQAYLASVEGQLDPEIASYAGGEQIFSLDVGGTDYTYDITNFQPGSISDDLMAPIPAPEPPAWALLLSALGLGWLASSHRRKKQLVPS